MTVIVFDIETIPDIEGGRRLYNLHDLSDKEVANVMFYKRRQETDDSEFLRLHLHRVVAISLVMRDHDSFKVWSLGDPDAPEEEIIRSFFDGIERHTPTLVSWNGGGFDLPVLHYRSLVHGISAPRYWETGEEDSSFKWNNYLSRFHTRHTDLMDVLAGFQPRANAPLDEMATLLGFPGKMGISGAKVWDAYRHGDIHSIRNYCETDVLNTYLIYLRFQLIRGQLTRSEYDKECRLVREVLKQQGKAHLEEFLSAWPEQT
jgi:predicted PolB exonuclease-like 3'-5' exonuclease